MNRLPSSLLLAVLVGVGGCSVPHRVPEVGDLPLIHKIDIQQGNVVTQEMLSQLQVGMEKNKVLFVMGTPVIKDTFHANRWDYLYLHKQGRKDTERRHVILYFEDDRLARIDGDVRPHAGPMEPIPRENRQVLVPNQYKPGFVSRIVSKLPFVKDEVTPDIPKKPVEKTVETIAEKAGAAKSGTEEQAEAMAVEPEKPGFFRRIFSKSESETPETAQTKPAPATTAKSEPASGESKTSTEAKPAAAKPEDGEQVAQHKTESAGEPEYGNVMNRGPVVSEPPTPDGDGGESPDEGMPDGPMAPPSPY
ncbi:MAG: outer membrane protein assembly factor BamE [Gammaproteobacteria bacterium]|nr:outer membrane protein assembly factor BamE [Gammaproteobacteria bacterium]MBI5614875.1 outer membrane protein assembly factor BamE [Gammaproteobacteria bacterium]